MSNGKDVGCLDTKGRLEMQGRLSYENSKKLSCSLGWDWGDTTVVSAQTALEDDDVTDELFKSKHIVGD